jgi:hypothetical protein
MSSSVPVSVPRSTSNTVPINQGPMRGPASVSLGEKQIPKVPQTDVGTSPAQPKLRSDYCHSTHVDFGNGSPSVPDMNGVLFRAGPIDEHYRTEIEVTDPYKRVNNPPTNGMFTWIKQYVNGIGLGTQNKSNTGFNNRSPQQRSSYMRVSTPNKGIKYVGGEQFVPHAIPQAPNIRKNVATVGTDPPGVRILNNSTFGAGQTAGGVGGNLYTPSPGPPETNVTSGNAGGMPTWG